VPFTERNAFDWDGRSGVRHRCTALAALVGQTELIAAFKLVCREAI